MASIAGMRVSRRWLNAMPELLVRVALAIARGFSMPASAKASIRTSAAEKYSGIADLGLTEFAKRCMPGALDAAERIL